MKNWPIKLYTNWLLLFVSYMCVFFFLNLIMLNTFSTILDSREI